MTSTHPIHDRPWGPQEMTWRLTALAGSSLVSLGVFGLTRPKDARKAFGMPSRTLGDVPSWKPKAARDLATGVMTLSLLALGNRRAVGTYALACALIPASDAVIVALAGSQNPWQVAMHAATSGGVVALGSTLLRERDRFEVQGTTS